MDYDFNQLRRDIIDRIGTASSFFPMAMSEISGIENASEDELLSLALSYGLDPADYAVY